MSSLYRSALLLPVFMAATAASLCGADPAPGDITTVKRLIVLQKEMSTVTKDGKTVSVVTEVPIKIEQIITLNPKACAVVICDMWDNHWCASAAKRCDVLAKKAGPVVEAARKAGMTVIHCPSDCMGFYADHPARKRAQAVKVTPPPAAKDLPNPPLPIDDSDGGCDDAGPSKQFRAWKKQHDAIGIDADKDYITDDGKEVYSILADRGIKTVIVMGVHTNMCVLNRTFAIKQLRKWDVDCLLVRDLTDTMYNPKMKPLVAHDAGTNLVIDYIERYWCPTILSFHMPAAKK
ncbi:isochorismatase family protein [Fimbriiglobus ruber]|uniref:isochorismatase family protein n=1 Tax=Fimbriiglobus ruber TaxID=1908690 RepID=UPI001EE6BC3E|nr:isochorismatase family protein [Fimbriiglobus ruber]